MTELAPVVISGVSFVAVTLLGMVTGLVTFVFKTSLDKAKDDHRYNADSIRTLETRMTRQEVELATTTTQSRAYADRLDEVVSDLASLRIDWQRTHDVVTRIEAMLKREHGGE